MRRLLELKGQRALVGTYYSVHRAKAGVKGERLRVTEREIREEMMELHKHDRRRRAGWSVES